MTRLRTLGAELFSCPTERQALYLIHPGLNRRAANGPQAPA
jgi:hypothetical protein